MRQINIRQINTDQQSEFGRVRLLPNRWKCFSLLSHIKKSRCSLGILTDFIIADRSEAEAINNANGTHMKTWPTLECKSIDHVKITNLWGLLNNNTAFDLEFLDKLCAWSREPSEDGPWVYLVPQEFVDKLLSHPKSQHQQLAQAWAKTEEFKLDRWTTEQVWEYFQQLVAFVRRSKEEKKDLLLWICV